MFSLAIVKSLQIYGIAICVSMFVAVIIKLLVVITGRVAKSQPAKTAPAPAPVPARSTTAGNTQGIPEEVVAAIAAAITSITGPHRILHIAESNRSWVLEGRSQLHSHQPKR